MYSTAKQIPVHSGIIKCLAVFSIHTLARALYIQIGGLSLTVSTDVKLPCSLAIGYLFYLY